MRLPRFPTKRLDKSHLTYDEKKEALAYGFAGTLLVFASVGLIAYDKIAFTQAQWWALGMLAIGLSMVAFVWGSIGTIEEERSQKNGA